MPKFKKYIIIKCFKHRFISFYTLIIYHDEMILRGYTNCLLLRSILIRQQKGYGSVSMKILYKWIFEKRLIAK